MAGRTSCLKDAAEGGFLRPLAGEHLVYRFICASGTGLLGQLNEIKLRSRVFFSDYAGHPNERQRSPKVARACSGEACKWMDALENRLLWERIRGKRLGCILWAPHETLGWGKWPTMGVSRVLGGVPLDIIAS
ncbi:MAG: hypothetical protein EBZ48_01865 [Proteobacteria bacterium]|nr:hypothetical protein [Pseudomonadota bacterium]